MKKTHSHEAGKTIIILTLSRLQIIFKEALTIYLTAMKISKKHINCDNKKIKPSVMCSIQSLTPYIFKMNKIHLQFAGELF